MRLQIVLRPILHTFPPIASQLVDRQFFEERPSLLGLALTSFPFALTVRYLGIRGRLADAASGGSLPNRIRLENHIVTILLFTDSKNNSNNLSISRLLRKKIILPIFFLTFHNLANLGHWLDKCSKRTGRFAIWCEWATWAYWRWRGTEVAN